MVFEELSADFADDTDSEKRQGGRGWSVFAKPRFAPPRTCIQCRSTFNRGFPLVQPRPPCHLKLQDVYHEGHEVHEGKNGRDESSRHGDLSSLRELRVLRSPTNHNQKGRNANQRPNSGLETCGRRFRRGQETCAEQRSGDLRRTKPSKRRHSVDQHGAWQLGRYLRGADAATNQLLSPSVRVDWKRANSADAERKTTSEFSHVRIRPPDRR